MNHHSIGGGSGAVGNLNTGDDFYQVTGGSGRVFYRDGGNPDVLKIQFLYFAFQTFNGLGLVVFHGDDRKVRFQDVPQDIDSPENFFRSLLHQTVVAGDVGFAFCSVDNQNLAVMSPDTGSQFGFGGKSGTAQTGNSHISYMIQQRVDRNLRVIRIGGIIKFLPGTVRIAFKNDAGFGQSAGMSDGSCGYGGNGAGACTGTCRSLDGDVRGSFLRTCWPGFTRTSAALPECCFSGMTRVSGIFSVTL